MRLSGACILNVLRKDTLRRLCSARPLILRTMAYSVEERGSLYGLDYRLFLKNGDKYVSPFHDVPLFANAEQTVCNMIMEVPRWTNAKMEINVSETMNPIKQDVKKGNVRFVHNVFPYHGYIWNYGALPQTWEDPSHVDPNTQCKGDNDPLDVCEIGYRVAKRGEVRQVKILGCVALIDEGETDWKMLAIDVTDPLAEKLNDVSDIENEMPGFLAATVEWFTKYKVPAGKPLNKFAFDGKAMDKSFATRIVSETHTQWKQLIENKQAEETTISRTNTTVQGSNLISQQDASAIVAKSPTPGPSTPVNPEVDRWYYVR